MSKHIFPNIIHADIAYRGISAPTKVSQK